MSLLNIELFRLGKNFSVRGHGAKFWATLSHQLFKRMVGTPHGSAGLGKYGTSKILFGRSKTFLTSEKNSVVTWATKMTISTVELDNC